MNPDDLIIEDGEIICRLNHYADEIFIGNRQQTKELIAKLQELVIELDTKD